MKKLIYICLLAGLAQACSSAPHASWPKDQGPHANPKPTVGKATTVHGDDANTLMDLFRDNGVPAEAGTSNQEAMVVDAIHCVLSYGTRNFPMCDLNVGGRILPVAGMSDEAVYHFLTQRGGLRHGVRDGEYVASAHEVACYRQPSDHAGATCDLVIDTTEP